MKKNKNYIPHAITFVSLAALPLLAGAVSDFNGLIDLIASLIKRIIPLLIAVAVILFIVGVIKYVMSGDDEEARGKSRNLMIYGIIGIFVIVSIWGFVAILRGTFISRDFVPNIENFIPFRI